MAHQAISVASVQLLPADLSGKFLHAAWAVQKRTARGGYNHARVRKAGWGRPWQGGPALGDCAAEPDRSAEHVKRVDLEEQPAVVAAPALEETQPVEVLAEPPPAPVWDEPKIETKPKRKPRKVLADATSELPSLLPTVETEPVSNNAILAAAAAIPPKAGQQQKLGPLSRSPLLHTEAPQGGRKPLPLFEIAVVAVLVVNAWSDDNQVLAFLPIAGAVVVAWLFGELVTQRVAQPERDEMEVRYGTAG